MTGFNFSFDYTVGLKSFLFTVLKRLSYIVVVKRLSWAYKFTFFFPSDSESVFVVFTNGVLRPQPSLNTCAMCVFHCSHKTFLFHFFFCSSFISQRRWVFFCFGFSLLARLMNDLSRPPSLFSILNGLISELSFFFLLFAFVLLKFFPFLIAFNH